jgi:uncharacterized protein (TIGR02300 family)
VAKPEWGTKRTCQACGARFYDLQRDPIHCPKCGAVHDPQAALKTRRGRAVVPEKPAKPAGKGKPEIDLIDPEVELEDAELAAEAAEEDEKDLIEDASELGEDDSDVAEVIEKVDEDEP